MLQFNSEYLFIKYKYNYLSSFFEEKREDDNYETRKNIKNKNVFNQRLYRGVH